MKTRSLLFALCIQAAAPAAFVFPSQAFDLNGAWASDSSMCPKIFTKTGSSVAFTPNSDLWGKGFIVDGNTIRGQTVQCVIKTRKENGASNNLIASCATDIMVDQVQLNFKVNNENSITRFFPGIEGMESTLVRCPF